MDRGKLITDLHWVLSEMDKLSERNGNQSPPPFGLTLITGEANSRLISTGQTVGLSRRYIEAIVEHLTARGQE